VPRQDGHHQPLHPRRLGRTGHVGRSHRHPPPGGVVRRRTDPLRRTGAAERPAGGRPGGALVVAAAVRVGDYHPTRGAHPTTS
jgi:hypothetical protein